MGSAKKITRKSGSNKDHEQWEKSYNALKMILHKQANKLNYLLEDRSLFNQHIQYLTDRWNSDVRTFQCVIFQIKSQLSISEMRNLFQSSKAERQLGFKHRDSLLTKRQLEHVRSELDDFKACFDILSHTCPDKQNISSDRLYELLKEKVDRHSFSKESNKHRSELEKQVAELKREYEALSVKLQSEISALQDENKFLWNQYNSMEGSYTSQLKSKDDEINQANEKITNLLKSMEQLQSASIEKDETVATLRANNTNLQAEVDKKDKDVSRLEKETESLRLKLSDGLPLSNNCSPDVTASCLKGRRRSRRNASGHLEEDAETLRVKVSELKSDINHKNKEISTLSKELKSLRSKVSADTTVFKRCVNEPSPPRSRGRGRGSCRKIGTAAVEEESSCMQLEVTVASQKVRISELEAQADQKDGEISVLSKDLRAKVNELESEINYKNEEISTLSKELKSLRSKVSADTPVFKRCVNEPSSPRSRGRGSCRKIGTAAVEEESYSVQLEATVASQKFRISELEAQADQKDGEISALSKELELLRSASAAKTPVLRRCGSRASTSRSRGIKDGRVRDSANLKEEAYSQQLVSEQGGRRSKRKQDSVTSIENTPKLFTSNFKLPKLKS